MLWPACSALAPETKDGTGIALLANLELPFELPMIAQSGAHGIGLLRSEFIFMNRETLPDEATQTRIYQDIVEAMDGDPVTIRVLDWGSDKDVEALSACMPATSESNPALGLRGIRMLLRHPALLETQIAAILRASAAGPVQIMLPMVSHCAEIHAGREILDRVWRRLKRKGVRMAAKKPPLGIMIETPAAALAAHHLARHADFFSIGTNDLTMYTLAADRGLAVGSKLYDPLEPPVLSLIRMTALAADAANIPHRGLRRACQPRPVRAAAAGPWHPPAFHARQRHSPGQARHSQRHLGAVRGHRRRRPRRPGCRHRARHYLPRLTPNGTPSKIALELPPLYALYGIGLLFALCLR